MTKGIFIIAIIGYLVYRLGRFLFKFLYLFSGDNGSQSSRTTFDEKRKPHGGNVSIDKVPNKTQTRKKYKGGEYVDYEEL
ncbi:hypothetical protein QQ020_26505 [Fulvivirgaceae bacterium BMA12]|uniref:DUF4834 domain-containing protein n=1 Tax=Agaribacillus aureus TaxID=3051825 RepID=A0ABT8LFB6_9BACT|nr:hypothetical protein [Fulvivirgaceae bacterium BMA12]